MIECKFFARKFALISCSTGIGDFKNLSSIQAVSTILDHSYHVNYGLCERLKTIYGIRIFTITKSKFKIFPVVYQCELNKTCIGFIGVQKKPFKSLQTTS